MRVRSPPDEADHAPRRQRLAPGRHPRARAGPRDALVRIAACGICGTDTSYIHMGMTPGHPIPLGHEMAGIVEWVGSEVTGVAVGDQVVVRPSDVGQRADGHRRRPRAGSPRCCTCPRPPTAPASSRCPTAWPSPPPPSPSPLAVGMQSVNQSDAKAGDKVVVFGCGPIGLLALATLADRGVDRHRGRRPQPGPPRAGQDGRGRPRDRPHRGRPVGRAQAHPRHDAVHVRADRRPPTSSSRPRAPTA